MAERAVEKAWQQHTWPQENSSGDDAGAGEAWPVSSLGRTGVGCWADAGPDDSNEGAAAANRPQLMAVEADEDEDEDEDEEVPQILAAGAGDSTDDDEDEDEEALQILAVGVGDGIDDEEESAAAPSSASSPAGEDEEEEDASSSSSSGSEEGDR